MNFTLNELSQIPSEIANKLLPYLEELAKEKQDYKLRIEQLEEEVEEANETKLSALTLYNELNGIYKETKDLMIRQSATLDEFIDSSITKQEHDRIVATIDKERDRIDALLFAKENHLAEANVKIKKLEQDIAKLQDDNKVLKDALVRTKSTSDLLARKLIEADAIPKKTKKAKPSIRSIINIDKCFVSRNDDPEISKIVKDVEKEIEQMIDSRQGVELKDGLYRLK